MPTKPIAETARYLDGAKFMKFLDSRYVGREEIRDLNPNHRKWREGRSLDVYTADTILTHLGMTIHELPDDIWLEGHRNAKRN